MPPYRLMSFGGDSLKSLNFSIVLCSIGPTDKSDEALLPLIRSNPLNGRT